MQRKSIKLLAILMCVIATACGNDIIDGIKCKVYSKPIRPKCLKVGEKVIDTDNKWDTQETCHQVDEHNRVYDIVKQLCH
jgi:hypothetical protein